MRPVLILGAAVWQNGPSPTLRRRTLHAAELWRKGQVSMVIPCGGLGQHPPTEAAMMSALLQAEGVPAASILPEDQSTSTFENIHFAQRLLTVKDVVIVTDRYHAKRAQMVAKHFGLIADVDCPAPRGRQIKHHLREAFARPAYAIRLRLQPRHD